MITWVRQCGVPVVEISANRHCLLFLHLSNCVVTECMEAISREHECPLIWQSAFCRFGTQLQQTATVQTELLGWAKVCSGRGAVVQKSLRETARPSNLPLPCSSDEGPDWVGSSLSRQPCSLQSRIAASLPSCATCSPCCSAPPLPTPTN